MNVLIVEDERHNSRMLMDMVQNMRPAWHFYEPLESVSDVVEWLGNNPQPDLIFMDIQLSDGICFNIFEKTNVQSMVIFTTAYDEYAIQSFKVNSIDYLLKPIKEKELQNAIEKFEQWHEKTNSQTPENNYGELVELIKSASTPTEYRKRFMVSKGKSLIKLDTENIAYFTKEEQTCFAVTFNNEQYLIDFTLDKLEQTLNPEMFFRCNRGAIINIEAIQRVESAFGSKLHVHTNVQGNKILKVSRLKASSFKNWVDK
ncbi:MAG: LytTR family DNA-binding domain-containing protein [Salinivirgaceae bacterium]|jgi:DNA-binding LytR/AlgR family response regulator|nr:LytTR family DNA-binding domain-containing protein [Salinivirgaceae bacterium]